MPRFQAHKCPPPSSSLSVSESSFSDALCFQAHQPAPLSSSPPESEPSFVTWHVTNEDSQTGGEEEEDQVSELGNMACHKRGLTFWRGGRERSRVMSLETQSITK